MIHALSSRDGGADNLSRLIQMLAPAGALDMHCRFAGGWLVDNVQAVSGEIPYHLILEGHGRLSVGSLVLDVAPGDVLMFPHGSAHRLQSLGPAEASGGAGREAERSFNGVLAELRLRGPGEEMDFLCGRFVLGAAGGLLLRTLPEVVGLRTAARADCAWLTSLVAMMRHEATTVEPGSPAVITQLSTALFTLLLRALMADRQVTAGMLALLADPRLAKAVDAVLTAPSQAWTVDRLAGECHMSRAAFARQFVEVSGLTPLEMVTGLRMELASRLLLTRQASVAIVGERCGYASEAAFGRAFRSHFGISPGAYRRNLSAGGQAGGAAA
jgi:AraC family transcriptional activator of mtrCDE